MSTPIQRSPDLYLASASPRRVELLQQLGLYPEQRVSDVPEARESNESPMAYSQRVALAKAEAIWTQLAELRKACVIGADTEVIDGDEVLGKPDDRIAAARMLRQLSARTHQALSSVAVIHGGRRYVASSVTQVEFGPIPEALLQHYLDSMEWSGKAGAYAIQGLAAAFVRRIDGSYSNVMGLPLYETRQLLCQSGYLAI